MKMTMRIRMRMSIISSIDIKAIRTVFNFIFLFMKKFYAFKTQTKTSK